MSIDGIKFKEFIEFIMLIIFKLFLMKFVMKIFVYKIKKINFNKIILMKCIMLERLKSCKFVVLVLSIYMVIF